MVIIVVAVAIGRSWNELSSPVLDLFVSVRVDESPPGWAIYLREHAPIRTLVALALDIVVGFTPSWMLVEWLEKLWPTIEFDFGPEHLKRRKQLRGRFAVIVTVLLLPFTLEVFKRYALGWQ